MARDKKIHEEPVPTVAKPETPDKLEGAPVEPEKKLEQPDESGDHSAGGLIRQAWSVREGDGMHEVDTRGHDIVPPQNSVGMSVARGDVGPMPRTRRAKAEESKARGARPEGAPPAPQPGKRR